MYRFCLFLSVLCLVISCSSSEIKQIELAEKIAYDHPDSALLLLDGIDRSRITSERERAYFALVKSLVLDLNYIDVQNDSLISVATNYYRNHGSIREKMLSYFYNAIVLKNAKQFSKAVIFFDKAESLASEIKDYRHIGLCNRYKTDLFTATNNIEESRRCVSKAIDAFNKGNMNSHRDYAEYSLAVTLVNMREYEKAENLIDSILSTNLNDTYLKEHYYKLLGNVYILKEDNNPEKAIELFHQASKRYYDILDCCHLAQAFAHSGQKDSAYKWINAGYSISHNNSDSAVVAYNHSRILAREGNFIEAYPMINKALLTQDSLTRELLQQSLTTVQRDNYKLEMELSQSISELIRQRFFFVVLIISLTSLFLIVFLFLRISRKNKELKEKIIALNEANLQTMDIKGSLFRDKFAILNEISSEYSNVDDGKQKELVFNQFKKALSELRTKDSLFVALEEDLNKYCSEVMLKLDQQVPAIRGENRRIIQLFFAGVNYETVMLIMKRQSLGSLKTLKSRFRQTIRNANAKDEELFLELLNTRRD